MAVRAGRAVPGIGRSPREYQNRCRGVEMIGHRSRIVSAAPVGSDESRQESGAGRWGLGDDFEMRGPARSRRRTGWGPGAGLDAGEPGRLESRADRPRSEIDRGGVLAQGIDESKEALHLPAALIRQSALRQDTSEQAADSSQ